MRCTACAAAFFVVISAGFARADNGASSAGADASFPKSRAEAATQSISPSMKFSNASLSSAGIGLRNLPGGAIYIQVPSPPVKKAYLYWQVITKGPPPAGVGTMALFGGSDASNFQDWAQELVAGEAVSTGLDFPAGDRCWEGSDRTTVYRADVTSLVQGSGYYVIGLNPEIYDPDAKFPAFNGASLVVIGTGKDTVLIYDKGFGGHYFVANQGYEYRLRLPFTSRSAKRVMFHSIGGDGQTGPNATSGDANFSTETTVINDLDIAGPGSGWNDSDWNGNSGGPAVRLWDNVIHNVSRSAKRGIGSYLDIRVHGTGTPGTPSDCLITAVNGLSVTLNGKKR